MELSRGEILWRSILHWAIIGKYTYRHEKKMDKNVLNVVNRTRSWKNRKNILNVLNREMNVLNRIIIKVKGRENETRNLYSQLNFLWKKLTYVLSFIINLSYGYELSTLHSLTTNEDYFLDNHKIKRMLECIWNKYQRRYKRMLQQNL